MKVSIKDLLKNLNEEQREAVINFNGPALILAGAGAGKTRVIVYRIAYMLMNNIKPHNILAITFTNKAADEMKNRIRELVGDEIAKNLSMGTFHSIFNKILRKEISRLNYKPNYTIYDTDDSLSLIQKIIKNFSFDTKKYNPKNVFSRISKAKNDLITYNKYYLSEYFFQDEKQNMSEIYNIYKTYQEKLFTLNAMDFDDILVNTYFLLKNNEDIKEKYANLYKYILIDEFQDTNIIQYEIIKLLCNKNSNICVVGDDSQSIYSFRGANIENIFQFPKDFPNTKKFTLTINYRSTQIIVNASNSLIEKNTKRYKKNTKTINEEGRPIYVLGFSSDYEEAEYIAKIIKSLVKDYGKKLSDIAILYRTNPQSKVLEDALRKNAIAYKIYRGFSFYQRKEIKDVIAYIKFCINPNDDISLGRIIDFPPRRIGEKTIEKLNNIAKEYNLLLWNVINNDELLNLNLEKNTINRIKNFRDLIIELSEKVNKLSAFEFISELFNKVPILQAYKDNDSEDRIQNIEELIRGIYDYTENVKNSEKIIPTIVDFYNSISTLTSLEEEDKEDKESVKLMTVHSAKGLEFDVVFIYGASERYFPFKRNNYPKNDSYEIDQNEEEERRLFYVAMTRSKHILFITYSNKQEKNYRCNEKEVISLSKSKFIKEIDKNYILEFCEKNLHSFEKIFFKKSSLNKNNTIRIGQRVRHNVLGEGIVINIDDEDDQQRVVVFFDNSGPITLMLKYAKLEVL